MPLEWRVALAAVAVFQCVLAYWMYRTASWLYYITNSTKLSFEETYLGATLPGQLLGWGLGLAIFVAGFFIVAAILRRLMSAPPSP